MDLRQRDRVTDILSRLALLGTAIETVRGLVPNHTTIRHRALDYAEQIAAELCEEFVKVVDETQR